MAGAPPIKNRSRMSSYGNGSRRPPRHHTIDWCWVKSHAGDVMNERADALARKGLAEFK